VCHRAALARGEFSRRARLAACRGLAEAGFSNGLDTARALFTPFSFSEILYSFKYSKNSLKHSKFIQIHTKLRKIPNIFFESL
jgi:hypothetical protein